MKRSIYKFEVSRSRIGDNHLESYVSNSGNGILLTCARFAQRLIGDKDRENLICIHLGGTGITGYETIAIGGLSSVTSDIPCMFRGAMLNAGTEQIVFAHNHPDQNATPSDIDCNFAMRQTVAAQRIGVQILANLVVTDTNWANILTDARYKYMISEANRRIKAMDMIVSTVYDMMPRKDPRDF